jgi:hypothetical protein
MKSSIPLLHITDLYHPPQDPDDQLDLATVVALDEFDLKGVILDITQHFLEAAPSGFDIPRDPGFIPVTQLAYLTGRTIPVASGPTQPLHHPEDDVHNRPRREQAGVELVLDTLQSSNVPVVLTVVGSARVVTAAFNRDPDLVRAKTRAVVLNAGSSGGTHREWNVELDPMAYEGLWRSGLPIHWYPCTTEHSPFDPAHKRSTYWKAPHSVLFEDLPAALRAWFAYGYSGSARGDILRALTEMGQGAVWEHVEAGVRHLWSTASLVMAAGRVLARTSQGWRFVPAAEAVDFEQWPWHLDPIEAAIDTTQQLSWQLVEESPVRLFRRLSGVAFGDDMAEALNALLRTLPL